MVVTLGMAKVTGLKILGMVDTTFFLNFSLIKCMIFFSSKKLKKF